MTIQKLRALPYPADYDRNEAYYDGRKRLDALGVSIPPEMRVLELVADWPRMVVEALCERLLLQGFTLAADKSVTDRFWSWWQANRMDQQAPMLYDEALTQGRAYALAGPGENNVPQITVHTSKQVRVLLTPLGMVSEALVSYFDPEGKPWEAHYEPGRVTHYAVYGSTRLRDKAFDTGLSRVPLIAYRNRATIRAPHGSSEMTGILSLTDAASRSLTNLQVAQETVAMPIRWLMNADTTQFRGPNGEPKTELEVYMGRLLTGPQGATAGQFTGADLSQITNSVNLYARQASTMTGLPPAAFGLATDNPPSAESLNAGERRHVKKAEQKQVSFGESSEDLMRVCDELVTGKVNPALMSLETEWRNAATPTLQLAAQAATQLVDSGIIPPSVGRDMIGLTPEQKRISNEYESGALDRAPVLADPADTR